jgi:hypothetical protein
MQKSGNILAPAVFSRSVIRSQIMTTIQIELSDTIASDAKRAGLLTQQALERLLANALAKQRAANYLLSIAEEVAAAGIAPMSMEEITAEVKAARQEMQKRADRH